ncbi:MAG TPA: RNA polymerase sigma factor [Kofleriaceae bacterium]|jgi:RNA polymerase sigma-70 factor (ECF subfamily)
MEVDAASLARESDRELARRAATGDRRAQHELFAQQKTSVHRALFRILGNNRDIEDLVQDSFIAIFRALPSYRAESALTRWCLTITTRVAFAYISRRKPASVDLALVEEIVPGDVDVQRHALAREAARRLYAALDRIEPKHRIAFALAKIDGRSLEEVAEMTESSLFAVKTRVWRARKTLYAKAKKDPVLAEYLDEFAEGGEHE